jgi:thymidylate synthase (FAD)
MQNSLENHLEDLVGWYEDLIHLGVCPEQARMILPQSMMTEWWWSGSLDAFSDMCNLRCKSDTQLETRIVADKISDKMGELFPVSWSALKDY